MLKQHKSIIKRLALSLSFLLVFGKAGFSQMTIYGPTCVEGGVSYTYYIGGGDYNDYYTWYISNGTSSNYNTSESGSGLLMLTITFNSYATYGDITVYNSSGSAFLNITVSAALSAGSITSNTSQTINYGYTPSAINCSAATGGGCSPSYNYQWQQSTDGTTWSDMSGKSSQNLSFSSGLTQTSYFRRKVTESYSGSVGYSSNTAVVYVNPQLNPNTLGPSSQDIFVGQSASTIAAGPAWGGGCNGSYTYQWEYSSDNNSFYEISGAIYLNYSPGAITTTTYYRRKVTCDFDYAYTPSVVVNVYSYLTAGAISPSTYNTAYNTSPGQLTATPATGGICGSYSYQWQKDIGYGNWTDISGATGQNYTPGAITSTTYYRRRVICGSDTLYTDVAVAILPLTSGTVSGGTGSILTGTSPGQLSMTASTGGNCYNSPIYVWQQSTDGVNFNTLESYGLSYTPGPLNVTTYFRCRTICGGSTVYSNARTITVFQHIDPGAILTPSFNVVYNTVPSTIVTTAASGVGDCSSISYQWQRSVDGANFTNITGDTSQNYSFSGGHTQKYFYRRRASCGIDEMYTDIVFVGIICPAGSITCSQVIQPGGTPAAFVLSNSGGVPGASMSYQWESSTDELNWSAISGTNSTSYTPSSPSGTTYYRVKVGCGNTTAYANTVRIKVNGSVTTNTPNTSTATSNQTAIAMPSYPVGTDPNNQNYFRSRTITKPNITDLASANALSSNTDVAQVTDYVDGLGRPIQSVAKGATPSGYDVIATTWYDQFGRVAQKYLPYTDNSSTGNFRTDPATQQPSFYNSYFNNTEGFYYSNSILEASPLNRVLKETAPGKSWTGSARGTRAEQRTNRVEEDVKIWSVGTTTGAVPSVTGVYNKGELFVTETTDESESKVIEYKDKEGKVILKKVLSSDVYCEAYSGWISTYYIYDDYGHLRWVLQPKAVEWLLANSWNLSANATVQNELCFRYEYDSRGRMIIKKVPGAEEVWMVYDDRDRLVMTQDGNLRAQTTKQWLVTTYDDLNRPTGTGLLNDVNNRSYHETQAAPPTAIPYPSTASGYDVLTETYYENYTYAGAKGYDGTLNSSLNAGSNPYAETPDNANLTKGMVTGTKTKVLGTSNYLISTVYYDSKGRVVETRADNVSGGEDITVNQYDFSGKLLSSYTKHQKPSNTTINVLTKMAYDHAGRVLNIKKSVNGSAEKLIAQNSYDELGQLKKKDLGQLSGGFLETLDYTYNIRGWLTSVNKDFATNSGQNANSRKFGMELSYDYGFAQNQFNGNIGGIKWRSIGDGEQRAYGFDYDNVNRLTKADFTQNNSGWNTSAGMDFSVSNLTYDVNGNIASMTQKGWKLTGSTIIDQLTYDYRVGGQGDELRNKLQAVNDGIATDNKLGDFTNNYTGTDDYDYDVNGNLKSDKNKAISSIGYNYLNLPSTIAVTSKGNISYVYDAAGNKLRKIATDNTIAGKTVTTTTTYIGGFIYESRQTSPSAADDYTDKLQFISMEEGRIRPKDDVNTPFVYDYFIKDHLGNVRMVLTDEVKTEYYPAATLEGSQTSGALSMVNWEKNFYTLDNTKITWTGLIPGWTSSLDYQNNNGTPPANSIASGSYPSNYTVDDGATSGNMYKTNGNSNKTALAMVVKVMAGDVMNIFGKSYYYAPGSTFNNSNSASLIAADLFNAFLGSSGNPASGKGISEANLETLNSGSYALPSNLIRGSDGSSSTSPKAYINYIILDDQLRYVTSGFSRVGSSGTVKSHWNDASMQNIAVPKNGYLYVYVSNESNQDVYFDNLQVVHARGPVLEETHYYPFGGRLAGISSEALNFGTPKNKRLFNKGSELQNEEFSDGSGLELYATEFRSYDPQLGRWWQIDPKPDMMWSPYSAMNDNPIRFNDPLGDTLVNDNDKKTAANMQKDFQKTTADLTKTRDEKNAQLASGKNEKNKPLSEKQIARLNKQVNNLNNRIGEVQKSVDRLNAITADPNHGYTFSNIGSSASAGATFINSSGYVEMDYMGSTSSFAHELAHGSGVAEGIYTIAANAAGQLGLGLPKGYTLGMFEVRAYSAQYGIDPSSLPNSDAGTPSDMSGITEDYIYGIKNASDGSYLYPRPKN